MRSRVTPPPPALSLGFFRRFGTASAVVGEFASAARIGILPEPWRTSFCPPPAAPLPPVGVVAPVLESSGAFVLVLGLSGTGAERASPAPPLPSSTSGGGDTEDSDLVADLGDVPVGDTPLAAAGLPFRTFLFSGSWCGPVRTRCESVPVTCQGPRLNKIFQRFLSRPINMSLVYSMRLWRPPREEEAPQPTRSRSALLRLRVTCQGPRLNKIF